MNMLEIDEIDDLLKEYELQEREVYINRTNQTLSQLEGIANRLAHAYESEYRANPTYENEERMRYWRYMGAKHWYTRSGGLYYTPTREYEQRKEEYEELVSQHKKVEEYEELVSQHKKVSERVDEKRHENPSAYGNKNIPTFIGLLGLTVGINVLVHLLFALAS
jgi:hypothetical protein